MLSPPLQHPLNMVTQSILTYGSWSIAMVLLVVTVARGRSNGTWFPVILVLASAVAALAEPLYDIAFKLLFFIPGQWTLFTYADIPQPLWTVSGYMILYAGPAVFICERLDRGISRQGFLLWAAATLLISSAFEIYGIAGGAYAYWGPHPLRILGYPVVVGVLETSFVMSFSVLAHAYRRQTGDGLTLLGIIPLFPLVFYGVNFGLGAPTLVMLGVAPPSPIGVMLGSLLSITAAVAVVVGLAGYVTRAPWSREQPVSWTHSRSLDHLV